MSHQRRRNIIHGFMFLAILGLGCFFTWNLSKNYYYKKGVFAVYETAADMVSDAAEEAYQVGIEVGIEAVRDQMEELCNTSKAFTLREFDRQAHRCIPAYQEEPRPQSNLQPDKYNIHLDH